MRRYCGYNKPWVAGGAHNYIVGGTVGLLPLPLAALTNERWHSLKILLIDAMFAFVDFAMRCDAQGHEVKVWFPKEADGSRTEVGEGLVTVVENWQSWMKWADLICTSDNARYIRELEGYRKQGYPIWGANLEVTAWELERGVGQKVLQDHGIECLPSTVFNTYDEAMEFLKKNPRRFVSKPTGDVDKALSYVSKGPEDMLFMLEYWKRTQKKKVPFLFQEFTPGIEMAVGGWVGRNGFSKWFLENFEFKKLMPGEVGVNTGEMGTAMKYCRAEESLLAREMLLPLEAALIRSGYTGYIDVAVIIDEKGQPHPLEFTSRMGWPLFQIQQVLHPDVAQWMLDAIEGRDTFDPQEQVAVGVVMAMPDFPYCKIPKKSLANFPVWGITEGNRYWVHPSDMKLGEATVLERGKFVKIPMMVTAGHYALVVSGRDWAVKGARDKAYKVLDELELPNSPIYRIDIGNRLEKQLPLLQKLGYAESWCWD